MEPDKDLRKLIERLRRASGAMRNLASNIAPALPPQMNAWANLCDAAAGIIEESVLCSHCGGAGEYETEGVGESVGKVMVSCSRCDGTGRRDLERSV